MKKYTGPWGEVQLKHLLARTLFGASQLELAFFRDKTMIECVEILLTPRSIPPPPIYTSPEADDPDVLPGNTFVFSPQIEKVERVRVHNVKMWWVGLLLNNERSITEKMVFFWRNHFAVEFNVVQDARYDYHYLNTLRQHATGNFKKLLREITVDPCMLVYLNGNLNNKTAPNENYGRELQELFSIGKGPDSHYTEGDVKTAAKILSGWKDDKIKIGSYFDPSAHNTDDKTFSEFYSNHKIRGRSGEEGATETDELISMICSNPEAARFICRKLYRWFVNCNIDEKVEKEVILPLSEILIKSDYEVMPVLKTIFTSSFFYEPDLIGCMIKSPIDFLCGIMHDFKVQFATDILTLYDHWDKVHTALFFLGEDIGDPPSVAGWPAFYEFPMYDRNWIRSEGLAMRNKIVRYFSNPSEVVETFFRIDYRSFVSRLPDPANSSALLADSLKLLCIVQPGESKIKYMKGLLEVSQKEPLSWADLWAAYKSNPEENKIKEETDYRLIKVFGIILVLPEYQIM